MKENYFKIQLKKLQQDCEFTDVQMEDIASFVIETVLDSMHDSEIQKAAMDFRFEELE